MKILFVYKMLAEEDIFLPLKMLLPLLLILFYFPLLQKPLAQRPCKNRYFSPKTMLFGCGIRGIHQNTAAILLVARISQSLVPY
jgi:hypothetical protein